MCPFVNIRSNYLFQAGAVFIWSPCTRMIHSVVSSSKMKYYKDHDKKRRFYVGEGAKKKIKMNNVHFGRTPPVCDEKPISTFETGTRISFFQSHVRDENENLFFSISCFETRTRISFCNLGYRDGNGNRD